LLAGQNDARNEIMTEANPIISIGIISMEIGI
jgi:hypothetical protein